LFLNWCHCSKTKRWATGGNWSRYAAPVATNNVGIINYTGGNSPSVGATANANNLVIATNATLTVAGDNTLSVSGHWMNNGTFAANRSTVELNGSNQYIGGDTAFYNLTKNVTAAATLTFENGTASRTTVTNALDLQGVSGALLSLRSDSAGSQWEIDPRGTRTIAYLDVKDSKNVNAAYINAVDMDCDDSGNNTKWVFSGSMIGISPASLTYTATYNSTNPASQNFTLTNSGDDEYTWTNTVTYGAGASGWFTPAPTNGSISAAGAQTCTGTVNIASLNAGTYYATNTVTSPTATNSPQTLAITLSVSLADQTITFPTISDQNVTNQLALSATASSALTVAFAVGSGPASINANVATFSATGT